MISASAAYPTVQSGTAASVLTTSASAARRMWFTRTLSNTMDEKRRDARLLASTSHAPGGADLSGGQQQRAAIAHAGAGAELLIAD